MGRHPVVTQRLHARPADKPGEQKHDRSHVSASRDISESAHPVSSQAQDRVLNWLHRFRRQVQPENGQESQQLCRLRLRCLLHSAKPRTHGSCCYTSTLRLDASTLTLHTTTATKVRAD